VIRVLVVDDHPAVRAGLRTILDSEPDIACVGDSDGRDESLWPRIVRDDPDVILLDHRLPHCSGLLVCHHVKQRVPTPGVILYSAFATVALAQAALLAGADAVLDKGTGVQELLQTIRQVHDKQRPLVISGPPPALSEPPDLPSFDLLVMQRTLQGVSAQELERELGLSHRELISVLERILVQLDRDTAAAPAGE
jgi:DNA-binding NarL/FixJ family response regulator